MVVGLVVVVVVSFDNGLAVGLLGKKVDQFFTKHLLSIPRKWSEGVERYFYQALTSAW
jgi:hypothetical protein